MHYVDVIAHRSERLCLQAILVVQTLIHELLRYNIRRSTFEKHFQELRSLRINLPVSKMDNNKYLNDKKE
jgi:hypothetical protein